MHTTELTVETGSTPGLVDLTDACRRFLAEAGADDGLLTVFVPHATAGVVVVELGAGSDADLLAALEALLPRDDRWRHRHGSPAMAPTTSSRCSWRPRSPCPWSAGG